MTYDNYKNKFGIFCKLLIIAIQIFIFNKNVFSQHIDVNINYSFIDFVSRGILETPDYGYLLVGGSHDINGEDYVIVKTDSIGGIDWINHGNKFDGFNWSSSISSGIYFENYYYLIGTCQPLLGGDWQIYFVKCDLFGNIIWDKTIPTTGIGYGSKIILSNDGKLLCGGYISDIAYGSGLHPWILKMDTSGIVLWDAVPLYPFNCAANDLIEFSSKIIFCGWGIQSSGTNYYSLITCLDSTGQIFWDHTFVDTVPSGFTSIAIDSNEFYIGNFYYNLDHPDLYPSGILKYDLSGNLIWNKKLNQLLHYGLGNFVDVNITTENNISISCDRVSTIKADTSCANLWIRDQDTPGYELTGSLIDVRNRIVETGYDQFFNSFLIIFSDSINTFINENSNQENEIFPNLFISNINIQQKYRIHSNIEIYNINCLLIKNFTIDEISNQINLSDLKDGMYVMRINNQFSTNLYKIIKQTLN